MERKDRLLDFVVFILCDYEELLNYGISFFNQPFKTLVSDPFAKTQEPIIEDYKVFLKKHMEPIPEILFQEDLYDDDFQIIGGFLNRGKESLLLSYLNSNYRHGYPDDIDEEGLPYGGNLNLDINKEELRNYFDWYLKFKKVNNEVYISYFMQYLQGIEHSAKDFFKKEIERIEKDEMQFNQLSPSLSNEFKNKKQEHYKKRLYKSIKRNELQVQGFIENFDSKDVFISFEETIINQLEILPVNFNDYNLGIKKINFNRSLSRLSLEYLNYTYFSIKPEYSKKNKVEIESAKNELFRLKSESSSLVNFLNEKGLNNEEINILYNLLNTNKFSVLNIRYHQFNRKVNQFHIFYSFYILDFYKNQLSDIKSFKN
jgi:hypothetical protein